jgi:hypothetical protein
MPLDLAFSATAGGTGIVRRYKEVLEIFNNLDFISLTVRFSGRIPAIYKYFY